MDRLKTAGDALQTGELGRGEAAMARHHVVIQREGQWLFDAVFADALGQVDNSRIVGIDRPIERTQKRLGAMGSRSQIDAAVTANTADQSKILKQNQEIYDARVARESEWFYSGIYRDRQVGMEDVALEANDSALRLLKAEQEHLLRSGLNRAKGQKSLLEQTFGPAGPAGSPIGTGNDFGNLIARKAGGGDVAGGIGQQEAGYKRLADSIANAIGNMRDTAPAVEEFTPRRASQRFGMEAMAGSIQAAILDQDDRKAKAQLNATLKIDDSLQEIKAMMFDGQMLA